MSDFENYLHDSSLCDDDPLWDEDEPEEDGSELSEQERAELEVALYSQLHFDHDPGHDLTDREVSSVVIEEEVPGSPPDLHELNWRERLLPGLGRVDMAGVGSEQGTVKVNSEGGHAHANTKTTKGKHTLPVQSEKDKQKTKKDKQKTKKDKQQTKKDKQQTKKDKQLKAEKKATNVGRTTASVGKGKEKLGKKKKIITKKAEKSITKIVVNDEGHKSKKSLPLRKKAKAKKKGAKEDSDLSKLLYRNTMENKVSALEMKKKKALIRASTPKTNAKRLVIMCTYSDDSDTDSDTGPPRKKKKKSREVMLQDMIVIDSISASELEEGNSDNPIVLHDSSDLEMSNIEAEVFATGGKSDIEEEKPSLSSSRESKSSSDDSESSSDDSESSSDESVTEVDADFQMGDIQTNLAGCGMTPRHPREPLGNHPPTEVSLDNLELDDYEDLTLEDIHLSLGDCDWGLVSADRYNATKSMTGRYFKKLDVTCHNCKEKGHLSKICPKPWKLPVCQHCGIEGHVVRGCPEPVCFNCLRLGHRREKCTARWRNIYSWCSRCEMQGHSKGECSDLWRQYHVTTEEGALNEVEVESNKRVFCYNCAAEGHWGHECEEERMDRYTLVQLPFIAQYKLACPDNTDSPDPHSNARSKENEKSKPKNARTRRENLGEVAKAGKRKRVSPPKKRRTQNEKFEAEYQGMLKKADENWNRNQHNKQSQKRKHTPRTSIKAQHTDDFIRSPKPTSQNYSHKHGRSYSLNEADYRRDSGFSRDNGMGKRRWADSFAHALPEGHVRERRAQSYTGQGRNRGSPKGGVAGSQGRGKQKNRKRQFTSERGFNGYF